ncbi:MAG: hypothetical protein M1833_000796 [Piccolia ochrophora]|nr:MAG: hypothetical protein M1833_000796 [Piccolia ochrophora]
MAQAKVVYANAQGGTTNGDLFGEKKFFISQHIRFRPSLVDKVKNNGGQVVKDEKVADILIVDHLKKNVPAGSYSYQYIDKSIENGILEDLDAHKVGPPSGTIREVGSSAPPKGTRTPFTAEDDRVLYDWVTSFERGGGKILGNEIYKQLAQENPRHTFQSWRDRWIKYVSHKPRRTAPSDDVPPHCSDMPHPSDPSTKGPPQDAILSPGSTLDQSSQQGPQGEARQSPTLTAEETKFLLENSHTILNIHEDELDALWAKVGQEFPHHTASAWRSFFEKTVLPMHNRLVATKSSRQSDMATSASSQLHSGSEPVPTGRSTSNAKRASRSPSYHPSTPPSAPVDENAHMGEGVMDEDVVHLEKQRMVQGRLAVANSPTLEVKEKPNDSADRRQDTRVGLDDYGSSEHQVADGGPTEADRPKVSYPDLNFRAEVETQALFHDRTQDLDFAIPDPEGGWDNILPDNDVAEHQPEPEEQETVDDDESRELDEWIDAMMKAGFAEDHVYTALHRTSMHTGLARSALRFLDIGAPIPKDMQGVWTEGEDEAMRGPDGRIIQQLERKHGKQAFEARIRFLRNYDAF